MRCQEIVMLMFSCKPYQVKQSTMFGFAHLNGSGETRDLYFEIIQINNVTPSIENFQVEYLENGK